MVDFHSHILPAIDDGSRDVAESLELIKLLKEQGINTVVATPHFIANQESLDSFLIRRSNAFNLLKTEFTDNDISILLGAEVKFYPGISRMEGLEKLCIEESNILLIEMPFEKWSELTVKEILEISNLKNLTVVIAHIDRYLSFGVSSAVDVFVQNGVLIQANADFLKGFFNRKKAFKMIDSNKLHLIGSDCHNITSRPPKIGEAYNVIEKNYGSDFVKFMTDFASKKLNS